MSFRRTVAVALLLGALAGPEAAAAEEPPTCRTYDAADGHEPLCNPYAAESSWEQGHRNAYSQHTSPIAGPRPGEEVRSTFHSFETTPVPGVTLGAFFPPRYADGRRAAVTLTVVGVNDNPIAKFDAATAERLSLYTHTTSGDGLPSERAALSGIYIISDRDGNVIQPRGDRFEVYGDGRTYDGQIRSLKQFVLPLRARCGSGDRLVGLTTRWDGLIGFVTERGMVGVLPIDHRKWRDDALVVHSINPADACARADRDDSGLETVSNSLSADEDGGMYPVTNRAQYRFDFQDGKVVPTWRAAYQTGTTSSVRQDDGSGSTPALMGTDPEDDKFVVITDGAPLTNLVLMWRGKVPDDWQGLPGKDRRIACEYPLRFGDPTITEAQNEQSVAIRGYSSLIPNNELRNVGPLEEVYGPLAAASGLPLQLAVAGVLGGLPTNQPYGFERVDWDPKTRTCKTVWVNKEVSIPNGVPTMSSGSNMVYGIGVRNGVWGLEGMDFDTGRSTLWAPASRNPLANSFYAATSIAPDGAIWSGAEQGFTVFRPPPREELRRVCKEFDVPTSALRSLRVVDRRLGARGTAADTGCGGLRAVDVSISRRAGERCRFVTSKGRLSAVRSCRRPLWLRAKGTAAWRVRTARLGRGRYVVRSRATDGAGNVERSTSDGRRATRGARTITLR